MSITIECPAPTQEVLIQRVIHWIPNLATYQAGYRFINGTTNIEGAIYLNHYLFDTSKAAFAAIDREVERYWTRYGWTVVRIDDDIT